MLNLDNIPARGLACHPGTILKQEFLKPLNITPAKLARDISIPVQYIRSIVNGYDDITAMIALLLAARFGNSYEYWMNLQLIYDTTKVLNSDVTLRDKLKAIESKFTQAERTTNAND